MSRYAEFETKIKSDKGLSAALTEMGFIHECHEEPVTLYDWHGKARPEIANIVIRRKDTGIGASNDIGFVKQADGTYRAIISDYDRGSRFNDAWLGKLHAEYNVSEQIAIQRRLGHVLHSREVVQVNGRNQVKLRFTAR